MHVAFLHASIHYTVPAGGQSKNHGGRIKACQCKGVILYEKIINKITKNYNIYAKIKMTTETSMCYNGVY